jgi:DNA-binding response OmpR family regulator
MSALDTLLVADDDDDVLALVAFALRRAGFPVVTAHDGSAALEQLRATAFALAVLDINMPGSDGLAVLAEIRRRSRMPVIMLSARHDDADVVHALETGADDYVRKPFSPASLIARVRALLRRSADTELTTFATQNGILDVERRTLEVERQRFTLTPLETVLLRSLFQQPGRLVAMDELATTAWGRAGAEERHALRQCMHRLRRKLEQLLGSRDVLETVRGGGYRWVDAPVAGVHGGPSHGSLPGAD